MIWARFRSVWKSQKKWLLMTFAANERGCFHVNAQQNHEESTILIDGRARTWNMGVQTKSPIFCSWVRLLSKMDYKQYVSVMTRPSAAVLHEARQLLSWMRRLNTLFDWSIPTYWGLEPFQPRMASKLFQGICLDKSRQKVRNHQTPSFCCEVWGVGRICPLLTWY